VARRPLSRLALLASPQDAGRMCCFISIPTRDTARAIAWYRDLLGVPESRVTAGELETSNVTLKLLGTGT
jgi:hypothetical protein